MSRSTQALGALTIFALGALATLVVQSLGSEAAPNVTEGQPGGELPPTPDEPRDEPWATQTEQMLKDRAGQLGVQMAEYRCHTTHCEVTAEHSSARERDEFMALLPHSVPELPRAMAKSDSPQTSYIVLFRE